MTVSVVDASALVSMYVADDRRRNAVVARVAGGDFLFAPAHVDAEVVSALRGLARANPALGHAVPIALRHLARLALRRYPLVPSLARMWELRENLTPYDAAYIALAERLRAPLITCDAKLAAAAAPLCQVDLII